MTRDPNPQAGEMKQRTSSYVSVQDMNLVDALAEVQRLRAERDALSHQLEADRTTVADAVTRLRRELDSRHWLTESRGSYEWDDDRYREEFFFAGRALIAAMEPLVKVAVNQDGCPKTSTEVAKARIDKDARIAELAAALDEAKKTWRCFHCGFETAKSAEAAAHFGDRDDAEEFTPVCNWWRSMSAEEKADTFQDTLQQLTAEREENAILQRRVEGLEYQVEGISAAVASRFGGCTSIDEAWHKYDSLEGEGLVAQQERDEARAQAARLAEALKLVARNAGQNIATTRWEHLEDRPDYERVADDICSNLAFDIDYINTALASTDSRAWLAEQKTAELERLVETFREMAWRAADGAKGETGMSMAFNEASHLVRERAAELRRKEGA